MPEIIQPRAPRRAVRWWRGIPASVVIIFLISTHTFAQPVRTHVIEYKTGTWCQYCPLGHIISERLLHDRHDVIIIAVHSSDPMEQYEYKRSCGLTSLPSGNVNRNRLEESPWNWSRILDEESGIPPYAGVDVAVEFDSVSRLMRATVSVTFAASVSDSFAIAVAVVEDGVQGKGSEYDQHNHYANGNPESSLFASLPSPVPAEMMVYNHVARALPGGYHGVRGDIPFDAQVGATYRRSFEYSVPAGFRAGYVSVAGMLLDGSGRIVNAGRSAYLDGARNARPLFVTSPVLRGTVGERYSYRVIVNDPDGEDLQLLAPDLPPWLSLGAMRFGLAELSGTPPEADTHRIALDLYDGSWHSRQDFKLQVGKYPGNKWRPVGEPDNLPYSVSDSRLAFSRNGDLHVLYVDRQTGRLSLLQYDGEWRSFGPEAIVPSQVQQASIAIASDDTPWVAYRLTGQSQSLGFVVRWDGQGWRTVGDGPISLVQASWIDIELDVNDKPHVVLCDASHGDRVRCMTWTGMNWQAAPGISGDYLSMRAGYQPSIVFDRLDRLLVSWTEPEKQIITSVYYENDSWNLIQFEGTSGEHHDIAISEDNTAILVHGAAESKSLQYEEWLTDFGWMENMGSVWNGSSEYHRLAADGNMFYAAFSDLTQEGRLTSMFFDCANYYPRWTFLGDPGFSAGKVSSLSITAYSGRPYVSFADEQEGGRLQVMAYGYEPLAIEAEQDAPQTFSIYPNPATSHFRLHIAHPGSAEYTLYDMLGRPVRAGSIVDASLDTELQVADLSPGLYLLAVTHGEGIAVRKICIRK